MKHLAFILVLMVAAATACNSDNGRQDPAPADTEDGHDQALETPSDTVFLDETFGPFPDDTVAGVLRSLKICDVYVDTVNKLVLPCDPQLFRAFSLNRTLSFADGFIMDVKPGVIPGTTTRRCFVVLQAAAGYKIVNDYMGTLLELRYRKQGYPELVIRYRDSRVGTIGVLHRWSDKNGSFEPVTVVEMNDHFVKPEFVDSLNDVYLRDFVWGY
jgi:hypothetical protein